MKRNKIGAVILAALVFASCNDSTGTLGLDMLPKVDGISTHTATFEVTTRSVLAEDGAVYAKTSTGYLGKYTDEKFGTYESSFLTQLNCVDNFNLPEVYKVTERDADGNPIKATGKMVKDEVLSAQLVINYTSWFGDSLNACRLSVYELKRELADQLKKDRLYTNIDVEKYCDKDKLLGRKAYTAYDLSVPDSVRNDKNYYYTPEIVIPLDKKKFGEDRILKVYRQHPELFKNSDTFIKEILGGVYVKNDFGNGTILYVDNVTLDMEFSFHVVNDTTGVALKKKDGTDSTYTATRTLFASTKEVVQANRFTNSGLNEILKEEDCTYIKTPAGIFTEATLPYDAINEQLNGDTLNAVKLTFTNHRQASTNSKFSMKAPSNVMLIRKKDYKAFFEESKIADKVTSFVAAHSSANQYTFNNIARLVATCIKEKEQAGNKEMDEDWNKVLLVPVKVVYDAQSSSSQSANVIGIEHDLQPGYAKLEGGEKGSKLKLDVISTRFNP